jgi:hypothetical protein
MVWCDNPNQKNHMQGPAIMKIKTNILQISALAMALSAQAAQTELPGASKTTIAITVATPVVVQATYRGMPWLDNSKLPWLNQSAGTTATTVAPADTDPKVAARQLNRALANLDQELSMTESALTSLTARLDTIPVPLEAPIDTGFEPIPAADFSALASRDLSTLVSQNLSVNCGQLLSTSLAVPTSLPWSTWGNKPGNVVVSTPNGPAVEPTLPPRTAWGNGPGVVLTTPGGAVYSMVPDAQRNRDAASVTAVHDMQHQLEMVQNEINTIRPLLENLSTNGVAMPPAYQPPYLTPTGRQR